MNPEKVFLYAEYQVSVPFDEIDWQPINQEMKKCNGLKSKTWLSGINNQTVGGFYEFSSLETARSYINELLIPFANKIQGTLSVKLFDGDVVADACKGMDSPYYF